MQLQTKQFTYTKYFHRKQPINKVRNWIEIFASHFLFVFIMVNLSFKNVQESIFRPGLVYVKKSRTKTNKIYTSADLQRKKKNFSYINIAHNPYAWGKLKWRRVPKYNTKIEIYNFLKNYATRKKRNSNIMERQCITLFLVEIYAPVVYISELYVKLLTK